MNSTNTILNNTHATANSWFTAIDKLMLWRGNWVPFDRKTSNLLLRVHYDQLLITADSKIVESFNMHHKMKGTYKNDIFIIIASNNSNEIRKIKFRIKTNVGQCLEALGCHFPVVNHVTTAPNQTFNSKYRNINHVLKEAIEQKENSNNESNMPTDYESFIKICLLDPGFPQMVCETEKILQKEILKN